MSFSTAKAWNGLAVTNFHLVLNSLMAEKYQTEAVTRREEGNCYPLAMHESEQNLR